MPLHRIIHLKIIYPAVTSVFAAKQSNAQPESDAMNPSEIEIWLYNMLVVFIQCLCSKYSNSDHRFE